MKTIFVNKTTNEEVSVFDLYINASGKVQSDGKRGERFLAKYSHIIQEEAKDEDGSSVFATVGDWYVKEGSRKRGTKPAKPAKEKAEPKAEPQPKDEPTKDEQPETHDIATETQTTAEPAKVEPTEDAVLLAQLLQRMKGGSVDTEAVRTIAREVLIELLSAAEPAKVAAIKMKVQEGSKNEDRRIIDMVKMMVVNDRVIGRYPWLYGPAGSGKSSMCKQIADELGLPYYSVSSLMQKYELEGYTDAAGELVKTSFFQAFKGGGIFVFDEASTSSGEVQVAFNTAAAQLIYNFPKEGMMSAHPDFHIIAADNSVGRGGDKKYSARYKLDVSTLDRYTFVEVGYSEAHDLRMAAGDKELVAFIKQLRTVLDTANTEYIASPRASKAIKAMQAGGMSDRDALWYGLCSGWKKQDIITFAARMTGTNKYTKIFKSFAS